MSETNIESKLSEAAFDKILLESKDIVFGLKGISLDIRHSGIGELTNQQRDNFIKELKNAVIKISEDMKLTNVTTTYKKTNTVTPLVAACVPLCIPVASMILNLTLKHPNAQPIAKCMCKIENFICIFCLC